jgi:hypothetical protein
MWRLFVLGTILAAGVLLPGRASRQAEASHPAKAVVLITHGDTINHVGDVPAQNLKQLPATKVGFKYSYWGIFWLDLWTWGGEYCLYSGQQYWKLQPAEAAQLLNKSASDLGKPFLYRFPLGLLLIVPFILLCCLVGFWQDSRKRKKMTQLFQDPEYQRALQIMAEESKKQQDEAVAAALKPEAPPAEDANAQKTTVTPFEAGVQHLVSAGIPRAKAEQDLGHLVQAISNTPRA